MSTAIKFSDVNGAGSAHPREIDAHTSAYAPTLKRLSERCSGYPGDILQQLLERSIVVLEPRIVDTLREAEKQLVRLADKATINVQDTYFDSVKALKHGLDDAVVQFTRRIEDALARLGEHTHRNMGRRDLASATVRLALADSNHLDESLVLSDIATKVELRVREPLYALGHRFAVLAGSSRIAAEVMPLGPRSITEAFRFGVSPLNLILEHRLVLYRCFERVVMNEIESFYTMLNDALAVQGVLPKLHMLPEMLESQAGSVGRRAAAAPASAGKVAGEIAAVPLVPTRPSALKPGLGAFAALRRLLSDCRHAETYTPSSDEMQLALATLQACRNAANVTGDEPAFCPGEQIKQEILALLREHSAAGLEPQIGEEDADTIDLVTMLFDFLSCSLRSNGIGSRILAKLEVPVLRSVFNDKTFFSDHAHPARKLLNDMVQVCRVWGDEIESGQDQELVEKLDQIADRVSGDYQGNPQVFTTAQRELQDHLEALARRIEVTERRHVQAARGLDKLDHCRQLVHAALEQRLAANKPNEFLRTVLERAWADVLVVTVLRDGEDSEAYAHRLAVADRLLSHADSSTQETDESGGFDLRTELESGLGQVGLHVDHIRAIACKLLSDSDIDADHAISQTELAMILKDKVRLGGADAVDSPRGFSTATSMPIAHENREQAMVERLLALPHGTWLEFRLNERGDVVRQKLAWHSRETGRCLLLNQRGMPVEVRTLEQLAREFVCDRARVADPDRTVLVDMALSSIRDTLKKFSNRVRKARVCREQRPAEGGKPDTIAAVPTRPALPPTLLLVDDEENILKALVRTLRCDGYRILTATNAEEGMAILDQHDVQVVISDQRMPVVSGTEFLNNVKDAHPSTIRLLLSGYSDAVAVTDAINRGTIYKFLTKPWDDEDLRLNVQNAFHAYDTVACPQVSYST